jgi:putative endonuclease
LGLLLSLKPPQRGAAFIQLNGSNFQWQNREISFACQISREFSVVSVDPSWFVYLIRTAQGHLYTGITTDVDRRLQEHQSGQAKAAKSLRGKGPHRLVFQEAVADRSAASRLEARIKSLSKRDKERLVRGELAINQL